MILGNSVLGAGILGAPDAGAAGASFVHPVLLSEAIDLSAASSAQPTYCLLDVLSLTSSLTAGLELLKTLTERLVLSEMLGSLTKHLVSAGLTITDVSLASVERFLLLAETLAITARASSSLEIAYRLAEALSLNDYATIARLMLAQDGAQFSAAAFQTVEALFKSQETLALAAEIRSAFVMIASDSLEVGASLASTLEVILRAKDGIAFIGSLPLQDGDYQAWVMNADTTGVTSYSNFQMDSLFTYQGVPYGLTSTGIYRLEGDDDDGEPIDAVVATGDLQFGTSRLKNMPRAYLYLTQSGQTILKTITSNQGSRHETYYELADRATDGDDDLAYRRVRLGRGVRGVWWRFELHTVDGASIDLDGAEVRPVVLSRRG